VTSHLESTPTTKGVGVGKAQLFLHPTLGGAAGRAAGMAEGRSLLIPPKPPPQPHPP